ncbi:unnamed protein product [Trifolium pratense]|uniref:Uncharacterized protein n=1 Tax=Trifolium pratense TaxID=57577 RepID=A0ACB0IM06_TRIPR|nr:unnamed protein product [Trifolium pratense]
MSSDNKMKGLLKGLRILSQIFDEKEQEIEIGNPTDVKHVAHIGWDGPTENNNPSWMNEFKSTSERSSGPLNMNGDNHSKELDDWASCDSMERSSKSMNDPDDTHTHELPLPKSSKQKSHSGNMRESHAKEKSDKPRQPKKHSKHSTPNDSFNESKHKTTEQPIQKDTNSLQIQGNTNDNLPPRVQSDNPKTTHSKKTKDVQGVSGSSKSRSKAQVKESNSNEVTHSRSSSKSKESNSNEGTHSRSSSKSKESNSNEGTHSRHSSKSKDPNSNDGSHARTSSKSKDSNSKEGPHSRSSTKSKDSNSNEGDLSRPNSKPRNKHRLSEEGGQLKRGSNENIMTNYPN